MRRGHKARIWGEHASDLAEAILALVSHGERGTFHAAGATPASRYAFTVRLAEALGVPTERVRPVRTPELGQAATRPPNSSLDSSKLERATGHRMASLPVTVSRLADAWRAEPA